MSVRKYPGPHLIYRVTLFLCCGGGGTAMAFSDAAVRYFPLYLFIYLTFIGMEAVHTYKDPPKKKGIKGERPLSRFLVIYMSNSPLDRTFSGSGIGIICEDCIDCVRALRLAAKPT